MVENKSLENENQVKVQDDKILSTYLLANSFIFLL
ncbi:MAG: hypothetical protein CI949_2502 [Halanaerobium sp.]|nr:MAG: hypothetical protein CI949_2502 [Halanaerobium sp.]